MKESPIFIKTYDLMKWLLEHTQKFPKSQRFVLAQRINEAILNFHDLLIKAIKSGQKVRLLYEADYELERLRLYLRLSKDLAIISFDQYEYASKKVVEIGSLLGGWLKKVQSNKAAADASTVRSCS